MTVVMPLCPLSVAALNKTEKRNFEDPNKSSTPSLDADIFPKCRHQPARGCSKPCTRHKSASSGACTRTHEDTPECHPTQSETPPQLGEIPFLSIKTSSTTYGNPAARESARSDGKATAQTTKNRKIRTLLLPLLETPVARGHIPLLQATTTALATATAAATSATTANTSWLAAWLTDWLCYSRSDAPAARASTPKFNFPLQ